MRGEIQTSSARTGRGTDEWGSPPEVIERARRLAPIALDPCTTEDNPIGAHSWLTLLRCGLTTPWLPLVRPVPGGQVYVNWPYSSSAAWVKKVRREAAHGFPITLLVPARTDTAWWEEIWEVTDACGLWRGRIHHKQIAAGESPQVDLFAGYPGMPEPDTFMDGGPATFPSAVIAINQSQRRFRAAFEDVAHIIVP